MLLGRKRTRQEEAADAERAADLVDREEVLLGERLGRRHQRTLMTPLDCSQEHVERHDRLAGPDVALEEALHGLLAAQVPVDLGNRFLLLGSERERERGSIARDQLPRLPERRGRGTLLVLAPPLCEAELQEEQLLERKALPGLLRLLTPLGPVDGGQCVGAQSCALALANVGGKRVRAPAGLRECLFGELAQLDRRDVFARRVKGDEPQCVETGAVGGDLVPLDLEGRQPPSRLEFAVDEQASAGLEAIDEIRLVEPQSHCSRPGCVGNDGLDDLQVAAPRWPELDALHRAVDGRVLPEAEFTERGRVAPVEVAAREILGEITHGEEPEPAETLRHPRPYTRERCERRLLVHPEPPLRRALVHASKAGQRLARTHREGQGISESTDRSGRPRALRPANRAPRLAAGRAASDARHHETDARLRLEFAARAIRRVRTGRSGPRRLARAARALRSARARSPMALQTRDRRRASRRAAARYRPGRLRMCSRRYRPLTPRDR